MLKPGDAVFIIAHSQFRGVYIGIASKLKEELECKVHLYTATNQEKKHYEFKYPGLFASVTVANLLYETCGKPIEDEDAVLKAAEANEHRLGVTINELAVSDRHLGRGFALGGYFHPRSRISEKTSYGQMLNAFNQLIEFWTDEMTKRKPTLILNADKVLYVLSRANGIPVRTLAGARYKNFYFWAHNEFLEPALPLSLGSTIEAEAQAELAIDRPYDGYVTYRKRFDHRTRFLPTLNACALMIARKIYWTIRRYEKAKGYYLKEQLQYLWRSRSDTLRMTSDNLPSLEDLEGTKFVFFPLATEPETALQGLSPEYMWQLTAIASICRDLPAGYKLIVKEHHTAVGRRPSNFYDQIEEFKNAGFMNMDEPGFFVAKAAKAVVTINGSSGFEAAVLGRPVVVFGQHNLFGILPHVYTVSDETPLKEGLRNALLGTGDAAAESGARFLAGLISISFDLGDFSPWKPDHVSESALAATHESLVASLKADRGVDVAA